MLAGPARVPARARKRKTATATPTAGRTPFMPPKGHRGGWDISILPSEYGISGVTANSGDRLSMGVERIRPSRGAPRVLAHTRADIALILRLTCRDPFACGPRRRRP